MSLKHAVCVDVLCVGGSLVPGAMAMSSIPLPSVIWLPTRRTHPHSPLSRGHPSSPRLWRNPGTPEPVSMGGVCLMVEIPSERVALVSNHSKGASRHHPFHTDLVGWVPERMAPRKKNKRDVSQAWLSRYHDPRAPGSLGGVQRFAKAHRLPWKKAQRVLERDLAYTLHKPRRRRFPTVPVIVGGLDDQWVGDLVEVQPLAKYNRGIRYLLPVLDVLSKYAWAQPLKAKTGVALVRAFDKILKRRRHPNRLQRDRGKEFYNRTFQRWLDEQGIEHFSTEGDAKASVVERFNRTLKERLYRYFTAANTLNLTMCYPSWSKGTMPHVIEVLAWPLKTWRGTTKKPCGNDCTTNGWKARKKPQFKVGDRVRLNKIHRTFEKGYLSGWAEEVFVVHRVAPGPVPTYKIREWDDTPVQGTFYEADLQKVHVSDQALFRIEKVLKRQKDRWLVKWTGWPDKYNSWIAHGDVTSLQPSKTNKETRPPQRRRD